ncbi:hypothetical protein llap_1224 [Limosa lapponica baueri]|uniref:Uncharacterized protein n=1 Tax=Limosa lapponica baueri TaxID=1758121 RepID=A0A2I0UR09_LIMLA|nr:hypothetical protein llap_1224 [Limosa lapponica baueri]
MLSVNLFGAGKRTAFPLPLEGLGVGNKKPSPPGQIVEEKIHKKSQDTIWQFSVCLEMHNNDNFCGLSHFNICGDAVDIMCQREEYISFDAYRCTEMKAKAITIFYSGLAFLNTKYLAGRYIYSIYDPIWSTVSSFGVLNTGRT